MGVVSFDLMLAHDSASLRHEETMKADRETTPYGVCVNQRTGEYYVFRRDYAVIDYAFKSLRHTLVNVTKRAGRVGHGPLAPKEDRDSWLTFWFFTDKTAPRWKQTRVWERP